jgi:hypothetical protein
LKPEDSVKENESLIDEYVIDEPVNLKEGPVKFEIVGDTAHLFEAEDFEKKEVLLLHETKESKNEDDLILNTTDSVSNQTHNNNENNQTIKIWNLYRSNHPECNGYNVTPNRSLNLVFRINGSSLTHLMSGSDPNDCFIVLFYVIFSRIAAKL